MASDTESNKIEFRQKPSEILTQYVRALSYQDLVKILSPVKARLLSEETVLCLNTVNFSVEHADFSFTVRDFLDFLGPTWQRWLHTTGSEIENQYYSATEEVVRYGGFDVGFDVDMPPTDFVSDFIDKLSKHQKRAILQCARDGLLTDESFLNISNYNGPDRIQVSMKKVVEIVGEYEARKHEAFFKKSIFIKLLHCCHLSSANFDYAKKTDLDVRSLYAGRQKMPIYFTILFALMTFCTFLSHVWSNITNYADIEEQSLALSISIVTVASLLIGVLMYLSAYIVGFLFCCESNLHPLSSTPIADLNSLQLHFYDLNHFEARIYAARVIQFILLWYTMLLSVYANEMELNIYPALTCVLSNGFGLMLFMRITHFLHACRKGTEDESKILYAR